MRQQLALSAIVGGPLLAAFIACGAESTGSSPPGDAGLGGRATTTTPNGGAGGSAGHGGSPLVDAGDDGASDASTWTPPDVLADEVWFTPNLKSPDMRNLFTEPHLWPISRERVKVFKFYSQHLIHESDETGGCNHTCGDNLWSQFKQGRAIELLTEWGIRIGMEGATEHGCISEGVIAANELALHNVQSVGGRVDYIAMDEPNTNHEEAECGKSNLAWTLDYIAAMKAIEPEIVIGDIEPYPFLSATEIITWIDALEQAGHKLPFFHLDANPHDAAFSWADVRTIRDACQARGIVFGPIITSNETASNYAYYDDALRWQNALLAELGGGRPEHVLFQSWAGLPGNQVTPVNLPELPTEPDAPLVYSHTQLIIQVTNELPL